MKKKCRIGRADPFYAYWALFFFFGVFLPVLSEENKMTEEENSEFWGNVLNPLFESSQEVEPENRKVDKVKSFEENISTQNQKEVKLHCKPVIMQLISNGKKRHYLVLSNKTYTVWIGDGDKPDLKILLKLNTEEDYTFTIQLHPEWTGGLAVGHPGITEPSGFLKRVNQNDKIIWEDEAFKSFGLWKDNKKKGEKTDQVEGKEKKKESE